MAKYVDLITGNFDELCKFLERELLATSFSASLRSKFRTKVNDVRCCVQVYERYSLSSSNCVSLNITLLEYQESIKIVAVAAGGRAYCFGKARTWTDWTWGEEKFLEKFKEAVSQYQKKDVIKKIR